MPPPVATSRGKPYRWRLWICGSIQAEEGWAKSEEVARSELLEAWQRFLSNADLVERDGSAAA